MLWQVVVALMHGLEFKLQLQEDYYSSIADAQLFGQVLHQFFTMFVAVNYFVRTRVCCAPSNKEFVWQDEHGANCPT